MRWIAAILILTLPAALASAADEPRRAQVAAATADALDTLRQDLLSEPVTADLTVEQFVDKTDSRPALARALRRAEQIGGTRWIDDQTVEVRMELRGSDLADTLVQIAAANPREAGLPADVLRERVAGLHDLTFAATGMSTRAVEHLRPAPDQAAWRGIPDEAIRAAVNDARLAAAQQLLASVETINLPDGGTLGNVFEDAQVRESLERWAMDRPVTSVEFRRDREVRLKIAATGEDFWDALVATVAGRDELRFPKDDDAARDELRTRVMARVEPTVGRARAGGAPSDPADAPGEAAPERGDVAVEIPADAPQWVTDHRDAKGTARPVDGRLKTARAAEKAARNLLLQDVEALALSRKLTIGAAARQDRRVRDAVDRTLRRAKVSKVNYLAGGSAQVSISLDLRELWYELDELR